MHLIYFINLKHFKLLNDAHDVTYSFITTVNVLHSEIEIFDLDTTTVRAGCSKTPASEKSQCQLFTLL